MFLMGPNYTGPHKTPNKPQNCHRKCLGTNVHTSVAIEHKELTKHPRIFRGLSWAFVDVWPHLATLGHTWTHVSVEVSKNVSHCAAVISERLSKMYTLLRQKNAKTFLTAIRRIRMLLYISYLSIT